MQPQQNEQQLPYKHFQYYNADEKLKTMFIHNPFGYTCAVCERLWFKNDLKLIPPICPTLINQHFINFVFLTARVSSTCHTSLKANKIPAMSITNGFKYHHRPVHLPFLNIITQRLISPRLPFMLIRRLRHGQGQYGICGQIINIHLNVNNMDTALPRNVNDDLAINVNIKRKQIHKSSFIMGMITKSHVKLWLQYLIKTPLFKFQNITKNNSFFNNDNLNLQRTSNIDQDAMSKIMTKDDSLHAQQQTLL